MNCAGGRPLIVIRQLQQSQQTPRRYLLSTSRRQRPNGKAARSVVPLNQSDRAHAARRKVSRRDDLAGNDELLLNRPGSDQETIRRIADVNNNAAVGGRGGGDGNGNLPPTTHDQSSGDSADGNGSSALGLIALIFFLLGTLYYVARKVADEGSSRGRSVWERLFKPIRNLFGRPTPERNDFLTLKRLQREVFATLSELSDRTYTLEKHENDRSRGGSHSGWKSGADLAPSIAAEVSLAGSIEAAPAAILSLGGLSDAAALLRGACSTPASLQARSDGSPLMRAQLSSAMRGGLDLVTAEVLIPAATSQLDTSGRESAGKLHKMTYVYNHRQHNSGKLIVGGTAGDIAATLNPAAGRGLSQLLRAGCSIHQRCCGTGVGAVVRIASRIHAAAVQLVDSGTRSCGSAGGSLVQATVAASSTCSIGMAWCCQMQSVVNATHAQSTTAKAADAGDWTLQGCFGGTVLPCPPSNKAAVSTLATMGTWNIRDAVLLSWWATSVAPPQQQHRASLVTVREYAATLASHPLRGPQGWQLAIGRSRGCQLGQLAWGEGSASAPWIAEASLHMPAGPGLILTPGLLAVRHRDVNAVALAVRAQWLF